MPLPKYSESKLTNCASLAPANVHELREPVLVPDDLRASESNAALLPRLNLLHPQIGCCGRVQVGLTADVGFVESEKSFGDVGVHLLLPLVPLRPVFGAPKAWDEFEFASEARVGTILPVPVPSDEAVGDVGAPVVVGAPRETSLRSLGVERKNGKYRKDGREEKCKELHFVCRRREGFCLASR